MTTTTISQQLQDLREGLEADKALLAKSQAIEIPPSLAEETLPAPPRAFQTWVIAFVAASVGFALGIATVALM